MRRLWSCAHDFSNLSRVTPRVLFGLKLDGVPTTGIRDQLINLLRQTATTTQAPTDSSTEAVDLGALLVFCLLFRKELETSAFSSSSELLSSHDISSEETRIFMKTEGFI